MQRPGPYSYDDPNGYYGSGGQPQRHQEPYYTGPTPPLDRGYQQPQGSRPYYFQPPGNLDGMHMWFRPEQLSKKSQLRNLIHSLVESIPYRLRPTARQEAVKRVTTSRRAEALPLRSFLQHTLLKVPILSLDTLIIHLILKRLTTRLSLHPLNCITTIHPAKYLFLRVLHRKPPTRSPSRR